MSGGSPSEAGLYATADAAFNYLLTRRDVDPRRIVAVGQSIGAAAAIYLASSRPVAGLATFSAFASMDKMARKVLPMFPTGLFLRSHFPNIQRISRVRCPIFLAHGTDDDLVPFAMMKQLTAKAGGPVTLYPVPGANQNNIFQVGGASLPQVFARFVNALPPAPAHWSGQAALTDRPGRARAPIPGASEDRPG